VDESATFKESTTSNATHAPSFPSWTSRSTKFSSVTSVVRITIAPKFEQFLEEYTEVAFKPSYSSQVAHSHFNQLTAPGNSYRVFG